MNKIKKVLVQVIKGFREGAVVVPGDLLEVDTRRVGAMIRLGYVKRINPDDPFDYPASKAEHKFQRVVIEEDEVKPVCDEPCCDEPIVEKSDSIDYLDYLNDGKISSLKEVGVHCIKDLDGWTIERLIELKGIGYSTAEKLMAEYQVRYGDGYNSDDDIETVTK